ncbi:MAG: hypothetical protein LC798_11810 [Chloroflexi bacterium]|nr:hypothetical protein [Chloroflexota bacterium]
MTTTRAADREPKVRGELVAILGLRPDGYAGLGAGDLTCTREYPGR